jgi:hypothetical protein
MNQYPSPFPHLLGIRIEKTKPHDARNVHVGLWTGSLWPYCRPTCIRLQSTDILSQGTSDLRVWNQLYSFALATLDFHSLRSDPGH